ncbi:SpoIIE family protein phosphatase [Actinomadura violacea]|uniref:SpoIIE family protein phosphatase n=1 Tax=Actinomadura violacea TaxID=2819934 RepID=A0ABS3S5V3_9ACTN|nr:SpoIIE family protein phosphatase [Actinomadura violacea]MBO2463585.1 SpoIIE family protein phosphatase [Actinomadura violacea]
MGGAGGRGMGWLALEAFDPAPVAVALTIGPDHRLVYTNLAFRAFVGDRPLGEPIGRAFTVTTKQDYGELFDRVLATGEPVSLVEAPVKPAAADAGDAERYFSFTLSPFTHERPGVLVVAVDVTEHAAAVRRADLATEEQRRARRRFESLVWINAQVVWVSDAAGQVIESSGGWERITGQSREEFLGDGWTLALHPDDREPTLRSWNRTRRQGRPWRYVYRVRTRDGEYRHFDVRAAPVVEDGVVVEWIGTCFDIELEWRERQRRELLDRAAAAAAEQTALTEMFGALAEVLVPGLADGCGVHLLPDLGDRPAGAPIIARRVATAAGNGLLRQPTGGEERFAPSSGFARALERRRPLQRTFPPGRPPADLLPKSSTDWLTAAGATSVVLMPVVVDGAVAAAVTAARRGDRGPMSRDDVALMRQIFEHTHDALSGAVRFHRTQQVALALQHGLLAEPPELDDLQIVARYMASPAAAEVGGDWYDSFVLPDGATVVAIGDVAGHDLAAAVEMSQLRNMLRVLTADRLAPPGEILRRLNNAMETVAPEATATCILARIEGPDRGRWQVNYAVAGHPPPLLVTPGGDGRFLQEATNPLLGFPFDQHYKSSTEPLPPGSTLLLYTDGLVEHPGEHLDNGLDRLRRHTSTLAHRSLEHLCDGLLDDLPTTGTDDIAMIAVRTPAS